MKSIENKTINYKPYTSIIFILLSLLGCGGGGGGDSASPAPVVETILTGDTTTGSEETSVDYTPDPNKLVITAKASSELYAEATFNFDSFKSVTFDISATDNLSQPLSAAMLLISVIDPDITAFDDPRLQDKSLLTKVFTDANGQIYITLEMAQSVDKVLLELNTLGLENDVIVVLDDTSAITYNFEKNN